MQGIQALVVMEHDLRELAIEAGKEAAEKVLAQFQEDMNRTPQDKQVERLRAYIEDRSSCSNPREHWAHSRHIRMIKPTKTGKPKSISWFQKFKKASMLDGCNSKASSDHGRLREWCFEDIANAWEYYHRQRLMRQS